MLRNRQKVGKFRIEKCLAKGPFANVYQGFDTIEGLRYALTAPHPYLADEQFMADFRKEARLTVRLDHHHIPRANRMATRQLSVAARERMAIPLDGQPSKPDDLSLIAFRRTPLGG